MKKQNKIPEGIRKFEGKLILDYKYTNKPEEKYERAHEKRRLKAYLKGNEYFYHGYEMFNGYKFPKRFDVYPK